MYTLNHLRPLFAILTLAGCAFSASSDVTAADSRCVPRCYYRTVIVDDYVRKPYVRYVVRYDCGGRAHRTRVVTWKSVRVPVAKRIRVCY